MKYLSRVVVLGVVSIGACLTYARDVTPARASVSPISVRALAPDVVDYIVDGDNGPNSANLIVPQDGLDFLEVFLPGDQTAELGGNMDFYPDSAETVLMEQFGASDSGPAQINITGGQQSNATLEGSLTIVGHIARPTTHGGSYAGDAETGTVTFGTSRPGFVYNEAKLAVAAPHGMGPVDPTFATTTCGSIFSYVLGSDPFTGVGKVDFPDGDCDGVIDGPMNYGMPLADLGSCLTARLLQQPIPNDPTCREDSMVLATLRVASPDTPLGLAEATYVQAPAPFADLSGIGHPTSGASASVPFELMGAPVALMTVRNPDCNAGASPDCVSDPLTTGNAAPQDCNPQPAMNLSTGAVVLRWDEIKDVDPTLALPIYRPVTASGRAVTRARMTWDSDDDNIVHPQENFSLSINIPDALPYRLSGVVGADLLCSGSTPGTASVGVTLGTMTSTFAVGVTDVVSLKLDMDIHNGAGVCDPIDSLTTAAVGSGALQMGVCLINPRGAVPVSVYHYNVTYDDSILAVPDVADVSPALDDNPDANAGATQFTSPTYTQGLGPFWDCDGTGSGGFPEGDTDPDSGSGNGNAYSGRCGSASSPNTLLQGPLGVITFNTLKAGIDTVSVGLAIVAGEDFNEIGSCNPAVDAPMVCAGGIVVVGCPAATGMSELNSDEEVRPNGPNLSGDDATWPYSDTTEDPCDPDDDNDGLNDTDELTGTACGGVPTNPADPDSDGDHVLDGWECDPWMGLPPSNPLDAADRQLGSGGGDADHDLVPDLWERRGYDTSISNGDSDGDGCPDWIEIASVDGDRSVGDSDRLAVARRALRIPPYDTDNVEQDFVFDIDHNGVIGDSDRLFVARAALLGSPWMPKTCP